MELGRKFSVGSAGTLIYAWHAPPSPRPPPPPPPVVPSAHASLGPVSSPPVPQAQTQPRPPQPSRHDSNKIVSEVAVGMGIGFGAAVLLVFTGVLVMWSSHRKRRILAALCQEAHPDKSRGNQKIITAYLIYIDYKI